MNKYYVYAILNAVLFGFSGIFVEFAYKEGFTSINLLVVQYFIAIVLLLGYAFLFNRKYLYVDKRSLFKMIFVLAVSNCFMSICYYNAFHHISVVITTLLLYTHPIIVFIIKSIMNREKVETRQLFYILLAFVGCILALNIFGENVKLNFIGVMFGLLAALFLSITNIYTEEKLQNVESVTMTIYITIFSFIYLSTYMIFTEGINFNFTAKGFSMAFLLATFCEIAPFLLLYSALKNIGAVKVSVISNIEIPVVIVLSYFILNSKIELIQFLGIALVMLSVVKIRK